MACSNVTGTDIDCHRRKIEDRAGKWFENIHLYSYFLQYIFFTFHTILEQTV